MLGEVVSVELILAQGGEVSVVAVRGVERNKAGGETEKIGWAWAVECYPRRLNCLHELLGVCEEV